MIIIIIINTTNITQLKNKWGLCPWRVRYFSVCVWHLPLPFYPFQAQKTESIPWERYQTTLSRKSSEQRFTEFAFELLFPVKKHACEGGCQGRPFPHLLFCIDPKKYCSATFLWENWKNPKPSVDSTSANGLHESPRCGARKTTQTKFQHQTDFIIFVCGNG